MEKPVIATNVGGIPELMNNEKTGFLVEKGNVKQLEEKIEMLLNDNQKSKTMGIEGRKFIQQNFEWDIIVKKFLESSKEFLNNRFVTS